MKCSPRILILIALWIVLIGWTYYGIVKYLGETTIFNHRDEEIAFQWPVVNICPMYWYDTNHTSTNFEEMEKEINQTMLSYTYAAMLPKGATTDKLQ